MQKQLITYRIYGTILQKCGIGAMHWITSDEVYVGGWTLDRPHGIGEHIWGG